MPEQWHAVRSSASSGGPAGAWLRLVTVFVSALSLAACGAQAATPSPPVEVTADVTAGATAKVTEDTTAAATPEVTTLEVVERPEWFGMEMTDVRTGEAFTINDPPDEWDGVVALLEK